MFIAPAADQVVKIKFWEWIWIPRVLFDLVGRARKCPKMFWEFPVVRADRGGDFLGFPGKILQNTQKPSKS